MKKTILILACVFLLAGCKDVKLTNGENAIVTFKEGGISSDELYKSLKSTYGADKIMELIDAHILNGLYETTDEEKDHVKQMLKTAKDSAKDMGADLDLYLTYYYGVSSEEAYKDYLSLEYKRDLWIEDYAQKSVTEKQINEYYETEVFGDIEASHILITVDAKNDATEDEKKTAEEAALNKAKDIIKKLKEGEDFATLAKENSKDDNTASKGGSLGKINKGDYADEVIESLRNLKDGSYTNTPVKSSYGYHIIYRTSQDKKPELDETLTESIRATIGLEMQKESSFSFTALKALREEHEMKFVDKELEEDFNTLISRYEAQYAN